MSEMSVETSIGELRCYKNENRDHPGFSIYFIPNDSEDQINIAMIEISDDIEASEIPFLAYLNRKCISPRTY